MAAQSERGTSRLPFIILGAVLVVAAIGVSLAFVHKLSSHKSTTAIMSPTPTTVVSSHAGTKSATLPAQKISFNYPDNWSLKTSSTVSADGASRVIDSATLTSQSGVSVSLRTGLKSSVVACPTCSVVGTGNISTLGINLNLNYQSSTGNSASVTSVELAEKPDCAVACSISPSNLVNSGVMMFVIYDGSFDAPTPHGFGFFQNNNDVAAAKQILSSMTYVR